MQNDYIPTLKAYTTHLVNYAKYVGNRMYSSRPPRENWHRARISDKARRRMNKLIDFIVDVSPEKWIYCKETKKHHKYKLGFLTLTLSSSQLSPLGSKVINSICKNPVCLRGFSVNPVFYRYSDNHIKEMLLNHFLTELRQKYTLTCYMWKAETQVNGNIHFHLIIDKFIHWELLRNAWNRIQNKLGLIDEFYSRHGHRHPNSIDIHSIRSIKRLKNYFSKYMTKTETDKRPVIGRLWGCSEYLSHYNGVDIELKGLLLQEFQHYPNKFAHAWHPNDFFSVFNISVMDIRNNVHNSRIAAAIEEAMYDKYGISIQYEYVNN